ncbi:hypothetical protein KCP76_07655 [Salmonella enterica subsp. enterica serovar Weltevreden]|nr:hypothetical protein KCP76_07655 [Salmonella enterica subsp. enterica serovar Weltevreden]
MGDVTTLSVIYRRAATSASGFNIGRIGGRLLDHRCSAGQKQQLNIIASPRLLATSAASRYPAERRNSLSVFQRRKRRDAWNLKKRCWEW